VTSLPEAPGLCFWFEAAGLHQAAQLYVELRTMTGCPVRVRPAPRELRTPQLWAVVVETPLTAVGGSGIPGWEDSMRDLARRHAGCRYVGWCSLPDPPD
jgi:hypothetical protein